MINDLAEADRFFQAMENEMQLRVNVGDPDPRLFMEIHKESIRLVTEFTSLDPDDIKILVERVMEDFWDFMIHDKGPKDIDSAKKKYPLGFWNAKGNRVYVGIGLDGVSETQLLDGLGTTLHLYDDIPDPIHWDLSYFDQGSVRCFIGSAEVREIDAVSNVPSMPHMQSQELAEWVRKVSKGRNQWQRQLASVRVHSIQKFADVSAGNHILTPILLYCEAGTNSVSIDWNTGSVEIDPSLFLKSTGAGFSDRKPTSAGSKDLRPLWIVDGQHRTRGMATSKRGSLMRVPIILLAGGDHPFAMDREAAAKLFTEINTYSEEIGYDLKHFLSHRFKLPGPASFDYESLKGGSSASFPRRRANTYAYRLAAYVSETASSKPLGPGSLERGFAISPGDSPGNQIKKIRIYLKKGLHEMRSWFLNDDVYGPLSQMQRYEDARDEVTAFFKALDKVAGANWQPMRGKPKSTLEKRNVVRYLLKGYPAIRSAARGKKRKTTVLDQDCFEKALAPLAKVNWMDTAGTSTGEWASKWFADWIVKAVQDGGDYEKRDVRSKDPAMGVLPGRGIKAPPASAEVEVIGAWPAVAGGRMSIVVTPPANAYLSEKLENLNIIINNNAATAHAKLSKKDRKYNVTISSLLDVPKQIDLTCTFKNPNMLESPFSERLARP